MSIKTATAENISVSGYGETSGSLTITSDNSNTSSLFGSIEIGNSGNGFATGNITGIAKSGD
jgi:hypothetical protein